LEALVPDLAETIETIRTLHRKRVFAMEQRKRADLALGAFLRTMLGWSKVLPEAERKRIAKAAQAITDGETESEWAELVNTTHGARAPFERIEKEALKQMERLAVTLPAWADFGKEIRGFGAGSLAVIVAEAGDLANYASEAKLWKRMGLAVIDGVRQGGLTKGASKDDWIVHGYSPQRRSRMWNIGDAIIKGNRDGAYRTIYLARKAYELARDPAMRPIHAHRRAQRYMEKRLLRHLWRAWNHEPAGDGRGKHAIAASLTLPSLAAPSESEAASSPVSPDQNPVAGLRPPSDEAGQSQGAVPALNAVPASSPPTAGDGHLHTAVSADMAVPSLAASEAA
jgi:hypothetical protein